MSEIQIKLVTIPECEQHEGFYKEIVKLKWICPVCGKERGKVEKVRSYDGSLYMNCDGWENHCGHVDKYSKIREEAQNNGLNIE